MDPDWAFERQLRLNVECWICGILIVQAATYRLRLINVISKQAKGRVRGGRPQEKVSWPSIPVRTRHIALNHHTGHVREERKQISTKMKITDLTSKTVRIPRYMKPD